MEDGLEVGQTPPATLKTLFSFEGHGAAQPRPQRGKP
jgi:hypothetical protein